MPVTRGDIISSILVALCLVYLLWSIANHAAVEKFSFPGQPRHAVESVIRVQGSSWH